MQQTTQTVISYFETISQIPRCSKQEQQLSRWLKQWAQERELVVRSDSAGNLVIRVPGTTGFEDAPTVILQGHMDMVCEKHAESEHDFTTDPIRMVQQGPWLAATETTLGADNGIALALSLAVADSVQVNHPPLELFFTVEEETGLNGVLKMDPGLLSGKLLVNLDSEDEGVFVVGCAGGRHTTIDRPLAVQALDKNDALLTITASGMRGGHSGIDIAKQRANANTVMARLLGAGLDVSPLRILKLNGGSARNVIPRACEALVACRPTDIDALEKTIGRMAGKIKQAYGETDPGLAVRIESQGPAGEARRGISQTDSALVVDLMTALPSGPIEMIREDPLRVQTSVNLSTVTVEKGSLSVTSSQRSSVPASLTAICRTVEAVGRLAGARVYTDTGYPSWPVNRDSALLRRCTALYRQLFDSEPAVQVMHAGLECGVIGDRCPGLDMISLGPTIENPHSPSERLYLPSLEKVWRLLIALLDSLVTKDEA